MGDWQERLLDWAGDSVSQTTPASSFKAVLSANRAHRHVYADLVIALFPQIEELWLELNREDHLLHAAMCRRFKKIVLTSISGTSLRNIAGLLMLPLLECSEFAYKFNADPGALACVPARSSSVQTLEIWQDDATREDARPNAAIVSALLTKCRDLKPLIFRIRECITYTGCESERLVNALGLVKDSLEHLELWFWHCHPLSPPKSVLDSFRGYSRIKSIKLFLRCFYESLKATMTLTT